MKFKVGDRVKSRFTNGPYKNLEGKVINTWQSSWNNVEYIDIKSTRYVGTLNFYAVDFKKIKKQNHPHTTIFN
jgi:hypothetical protein